MQILIGSTTLHLKQIRPGRTASAGFGVDGGHTGPGCWKIETVPGVMKNPNQANYYRRLFTSKFYQKGVFQYMFGGILRAIFGVFSPYQYWDREREKDLHEDLKESYIQSKRTHAYGIYTFQVNRTVQTNGVKWNQGVRPPHFEGSWVKRGSQKKARFSILKGSYVYVRVNKLDWDRPVFDIEYYSFKTKAAEVVSVDLNTFRYIMRAGKFIRQADFDGGRFYPLYRSRRGKRV